jgi:hypothetical protein
MYFVHADFQPINSLHWEILKLRDQAMSDVTLKVLCDMRDISAGRDTATSSQDSEAAPAPTRFVRKQEVKSVKPNLGLSMTLGGTGLLTSHRPEIEDVGGSTREMVGPFNSQRGAAKYFDAHRQYVAKLLIAPESWMDICLDTETSKERYKRTRL